MKAHSQFIFVCIFAIFLFVIAMYALRDEVDQDAARFGLMARHILAGKHFPIFYYGRAYVGSLKAYLMAALFALIGPTNFAVILSTALLTAAFFYLTFAFVREAYGRRAALLTAGYFALPPPVLGLWYTKPTSPFAGLLATGAALTLLGYRLIFTDLGGRKRCLHNLLFGFLAGIGWWLSSMILYYVVPLAIFWLIKRPKRLWKEDLPVVLATFLLGSLPFWLHNIYHNFMTLGLAQPLDWSQAGEFSHRMLFSRLPELLEISSEWGKRPVWELWLRRTLGIAYVLLIIYTLWGSRGKSKILIKRKSAELGVTWMLLLLAGFAVWTYITTGYQASKTERLVLPLYWVVPILFAFSTSQLINKRKVAGWMLCSLVVVVHIIGNIACWRDNPIRGFRKKHQKLISYLLQKELLYVTTDFFTAPVLSFESGESIIASDGFSACTIPGYLERVLSASNYACIFPFGQSHGFESGLRTIGASRERDLVGRYKVYHSFSKDVVSYEQIIPKRWKASATGRDNASLAFDRILSTRWATGRAQEEGQYFELDLGGVFKIGKVELLTQILLDYARGLRILTSIDGKRWEEALRAKSSFPPMRWCGPKPVWHDSSELGAEFIFPARKVRFIRIELTKKSGSRWWWSINEIFVYSATNSSIHDYDNLKPGELIRVLDREGVESVFTGFWIASRLISAGFPQDRVSTIENRFDYHNSLRPKPLPPDRRVSMASGTGLLLWERETKEAVNILDEQGIRYVREKVGELELIKILSQASSIEYSPISRAGWKAEASPSGNNPWFAIDGSMETRWTSERMQFPGMVFELDMGKVANVCGVELNADRERRDQPVALELWVSLDGRKWERVNLSSNSYEFLWTGKHLLISSKRVPVMLYTFSPRSLRYIRLVQKGTDALHYWSIREIKAYSSQLASEG